MFAWYRELLEIRRENNRENELIETLKHEIEMLRLERDRLLTKILQGNELSTNERSSAVEYQPIPPRIVPWSVRRQMLEKEDRAAAKILKENRKVTEPLSVQDLEEELDIVAKEREGESNAVR